MHTHLGVCSEAGECAAAAEAGAAAREPSKTVAAGKAATVARWLAMGSAGTSAARKKAAVKERARARHQLARENMVWAMWIG